MVLARSTRDLFDYVLLEDLKLPPEKRTVFHLRAISGQLALRVHAAAQAKPVALLTGVAGWSNFRDANGDEIPCKHTKGRKIIEGIELAEWLSDESLEWLSLPMINELATAVLRGNALDADDVKN